MRSVPTERMSYASDRGLLMEYLPSFIGNFRPIPTGRASELGCFLPVKIRNEVSCETEIVGAAPSPRFRDTFGNKALLSAEMSETLENFEAELKATGFMHDGEVLIQYATTPRKFRVQRLKLPLRVASADERDRFSHSCSPLLLRRPLSKRRTALF